MVIRKSLAEIEKMRRSGLIVAQVLKRIRSLAAPGMTTLELDTIAESIIRGAGAIPTFKGYRGFPASICASVNEEVVHGIPSVRQLRDGDLLKIDCGATLDGYVGDAAISIPIGKVAPETLRLHEVTRQSLLRAIEQMFLTTGFTMSLRRFRSASKRLDLVLSGISVDTGSVNGCTKILRSPIMADLEPVQD